MPWKWLSGLLGCCEDIILWVNASFENCTVIFLFMCSLLKSTLYFWMVLAEKAFFFTWDCCELREKKQREFLPSRHLVVCDNSSPSTISSPSFDKPLPNPLDIEREKLFSDVVKERLLTWRTTGQQPRDHLNLLPQACCSNPSISCLGYSVLWGDIHWICQSTVSQMQLGWIKSTDLQWESPMVRFDQSGICQDPGFSDTQK